MKKKIFIALLFGLFLFIGGGRVSAAGQLAFNINTNPGADLSKEIQVNWHSDLQGTVLEYTLKSDAAFANKVTITPAERHWTIPAEARGDLLPPRYVMNATLSDLTPGTEYQYRIAKDGQYSAIYNFKTAAPGTISFLHITDPQFASQTQANVFNSLMSKAYELNPNLAFTFFTGDMIDRGGVANQWQMFFNASNMKTNTIATVPGNHEYYDFNGPGAYIEDFYNIHFNNPKNGTESALNTSYYFRVNHVLFVGINSEKKGQSDQVEWFDKVMEANSDAKFVIVGMHRSSYGSIYAGDSVNVRFNWQRVFDKHGVDLVLSGHDHIYARSKHIYSDAISTDPIRGTTYIIGGSGGQKFYDPVNNTKYQKVISHTSVANMITVSETEITLNLIDQSGKTLDTLEEPIKTKRVGTVNPSFDKEAFVADMKVYNLAQTPTNAFITWDKNGYGNVVAVRRLDSIGLIRSEVFMYHESLTKIDFLLNANTLNKIPVEVLFKDGSKIITEYQIDLTPPKPHITLFETLDRMQSSLIDAIRGVYNGDGS